VRDAATAAAAESPCAYRAAGSGRADLPGGRLVEPTDERGSGTDPSGARRQNLTKPTW